MKLFLLPYAVVSIRASLSGERIGVFMANLLIVFHSQSGRNESLALCCYSEAKKHNTGDVHLRRAYDADLNDLRWADFLLLITPENFGAIAGGMKGFFDLFFYPAENAGIAALPYCCIICTGNDGSQTVIQIDKIMKGLCSEPVQPPLVIYGRPDGEAFERCRALSEALVSALEMGIY